MKKQRTAIRQAQFYEKQQQVLQKKNGHIATVINELKTTKMQEKVISSLSNIETLMVNKLHNTQQKLNVLKTTDKKDVVEFLDRNEIGSRGRKRSTSKSKKYSNKLRNVHELRLNNPPMQFVDRANTLDQWGGAGGRQPNASMMDSLMESPKYRKRSTSKRKNLDYVSIISSRNGASSRSRSQSKPMRGNRSTSQRSRSTSKPR